MHGNAEGSRSNFGLPMRAASQHKAESMNNFPPCFEFEAVDSDLTANAQAEIPSLA